MQATTLQTEPASTSQAYIAVEQKEANANKQTSRKRYHRRYISMNWITRYLPKKNTSESPPPSTDFINRTAKTVEAALPTNQWPGLINQYQEHPLLAACREGKKSITIEMLDRNPELINQSFICGRSKTKCHPLHIAATKKQMGIAQILMNKGADINTKDDIVWTPLHCASKQGHLEMARFFLDNHADVDAQSKYGRTPLHVAVDNGHLNIVRLFLERQADVNAKTEYKYGEVGQT